MIRVTVFVYPEVTELAIVAEELVVVDGAILVVGILKVLFDDDA